ncbi:MAG: hypothetical protein IJX84_09635 [Clostridia bacterium]|nr:hypothetical protein [Clostridia bacterium]
MRKLTALVLALCLVCSMTCAVAEETQEIKVGKMSLLLPAGLEGAGFYSNDEEGLSITNYLCEDYSVTVNTLEMGLVGDAYSLSRDQLEDDNATVLSWSLQLFAGLDGETAQTFVQTSKQVNLQEREWKVFSAENLVILAHCSQGTGVAIMLALNNEGTSISQNELTTIGFDIACTLCVEEDVEQ